jgi:outer membrane protein OmpA-like peptidoglycan-associated protein
MSNNIRRLGIKVACSMMAGGLALALGIGFAGAGEQPSAATIINTLTPKPPLTRSLSSATTPAEKAKNAEDVKFLSTLKNRTTRSLSMGERDQIATIAQDKPSIDLEINFEFNSDQISRSAAATVDALGKALTDPALKGNTFILAGHTDGKGRPDYNQDLSERRADSVKRALSEKFGIPASSLVTAGYGQSRLKNSKDPFAAENRRVAVTNMADSKVSEK